jgi:mannan endo-1,4-beta-mannosidase
MMRPSYNTGTGFFVSGRKLYDANGVEFRIRGLNKLHFDFTPTGYYNTHANTVRYNFYWGGPSSPTASGGTPSASTNAYNLAAAQSLIKNKIVPMFAPQFNAAGTGTSGSTNSADMMSDATAWASWITASASSYKSIERYALLNIANEWGPQNSAAWSSAYITAISSLRTAGWLGTIVVDAGGWGQDLDDLVNYGPAVLAGDPQHNVLFDLHVYGLWEYQTTQNVPFVLSTGFAKLAATGLAVVVGEFGPSSPPLNSPSPTKLTPDQIIQAAEANGFGWMPWAWDDPETCSTACNTGFSMSNDGNYNAPSDLTSYGQDFVLNPTFGIQTLARPATVF